jgi:hypothetical protein
VIVSRLIKWEAARCRPHPILDHNLFDSLGEARDTGEMGSAQGCRATSLDRACLSGSDRGCNGESNFGNRVGVTGIMFLMTELISSIRPQPLAMRANKASRSTVRLPGG